MIPSTSLPPSGTTTQNLKSILKNTSSTNTSGITGFKKGVKFDDKVIVRSTLRMTAERAVAVVTPAGVYTTLPLTSSQVLRLSGIQPLVDNQDTRQSEGPKEQYGRILVLWRVFELQLIPGKTVLEMLTEGLVSPDLFPTITDTFVSSESTIEAHEGKGYLRRIAAMCVFYKTLFHVKTKDDTMTERDRAIEGILKDLASMHILGLTIADITTGDMESAMNAEIKASRYNTTTFMAQMAKVVEQVVILRATMLN